MGFDDLIFLVFDLVEFIVAYEVFVVGVVLGVSKLLVYENLLAADKILQYDLGHLSLLWLLLIPTLLLWQYFGLSLDKLKISIFEKMYFTGNTLNFSIFW